MALREGAISGDTLANMVDDHSNGARFVSSSQDMNIPKMQGFLPSPLFKNLADASVSAPAETRASADAKTYVSPAVSPNIKRG